MSKTLAPVAAAVALYAPGATIPADMLSAAAALMNGPGLDAAPADALRAAAGDKPAAVRAAARAVGRAVFHAVRDGNLNPLREAATAAAGMGKAATVRGAFVAALSAAVTGPAGETIPAPLVLFLPDRAGKGQPQAPAGLTLSQDAKALRRNTDAAGAFALAACGAFLSAVREAETLRAAAAAARKAAPAAAPAAADASGAPAADASGDPINPAPVLRPIDAALSALATAAALIPADSLPDSLRAALERCPGLPLAALAAAADAVLSARAADAVKDAADSATRAAAAAEAAGILRDAAAAAPAAPAAASGQPCPADDGRVAPDGLPMVPPAAEAAPAAAEAAPAAAEAAPAAAAPAAAAPAAPAQRRSRSRSRSAEAVAA